MSSLAIATCQLRPSSKSLRECSSCMELCSLVHIALQRYFIGLLIPFPLCFLCNTTHYKFTTSIFIFCLSIFCISFCSLFYFYLLILLLMLLSHFLSPSTPPPLLLELSITNIASILHPLPCTLPEHTMHPLLSMAVSQHMHNWSNPPCLQLALAP